MAKNKRIQALVKYLTENGNTVSYDDLEPSKYDKMIIEDGTREYLVCTDKEADKRTAEYIKDSVWAFNASFIANHSRMDYDSTITVVKALQDKCESANEPIKGLIKNMNKFVSDAIRDDGRGHFLNHYDGNEDDVKLGNTNYFIYRIN